MGCGGGKRRSGRHTIWRVSLTLPGGKGGVRPVAKSCFRQKLFLDVEAGFLCRADPLPEIFARSWGHSSGSEGTLECLVVSFCDRFDVSWSVVVVVLVTGTFT